MAFFARPYYTADPSFTSLFRLLDDFDSYSREVKGNSNGKSHHSKRHFAPRFDVRETENEYLLHGELPGIDKSNVHIEFTDPQTLIVRGHVERTYTSGNPHAGLVENSEVTGAITEAGEASPVASHKTTVEDESTEEAKEQGTAVEKAEPVVSEKQQPSDKYWSMERSVGEFSRTFNFPSRVDQEGVNAQLDNGILTVTVPKAKKLEARRITIN